MNHPPAGHASRWSLMLGAIGVVYGDIGTSPLYAIKECFSPENPHHIDVTEANVLGVMSLVFWALTMVIVVKYLTFIMRADNEGSGGILALLALVPKHLRAGGAAVTLLALFGTALLYGDGVITPAISVLSAVEGLEVATAKLKPVVVPLTVVILVVLFAVQKRGTGGIGKVFGPAMIVWFAMLGALGVNELREHPTILRALDPRYAVTFFLANGKTGFLVLGSVFLVVTGGEALYADMGHFGRAPIRRAWFALVFPALLLNYFGQGARLLADPASASNPFYALVPSWALYPVVGIATLATVVASQALISGAFSLTQQAVQLGYFPRVTIVHTSREEAGQIYVPEINELLLVGSCCCVAAFGSSTALAAAYGIAVTGTMGITTIIYFVVTTKTWRWPLYRAVPLVVLFLTFDLAFFSANAAKFLHGGWFPIAMGIAVFLVMTTWHRGRQLLADAIAPTLLPLAQFLESVEMEKPHRVKGVAVFMASSPEGTPPALLHNFKHNQILHEKVVLLSIQSSPVPDVPSAQRVEVEPLAHGFWRVTARYGFVQKPNVPEALRLCKTQGLDVDVERASYYLGRETIVPSGKSPMFAWRKRLFVFIARNARTATAYFGLPPNRVVELGAQIQL
jgi:KUP system potassium uptake protein